MRKIIIIVNFLMVFLLSAATASAQATYDYLDLTSVGVTDTTGTYYSSYEYEGENPTMTGTALEDSDVEIDIDGEIDVVVADELGVWTYTPTVLVEGEYDVMITSEDEVMEFTLTITEATTTGKGGLTDDEEEVLLDSGIEDYTYAIGFAGLLATFFGVTLAVAGVKN
jgi:outer membrane lipoprotein-sorting protein